MSCIQYLMASALLCSAISVMPSTIPACTCRVPSPQEAFKKSDVVFLARLIQFRKKRFKRKSYPALALKVEKVWKGDIEADVVLCYADIPGWCGDLDLVAGQQYVLYAERFESLNGELIVMGDCWRGPRVDKAEADFAFFATQPAPHEPAHRR